MCELNAGRELDALVSARVVGDDVKEPIPHYSTSENAAKELTKEEGRHIPEPKGRLIYA